ncbi:hypothetical protein [Haloarchaeobius amylolyticus]|uniref:hypothetical protein n=1 Tax=Haloarchaeobius amylolyticus TaxID=1198296 RepID=UPI00226FFD25|nr:hypothetical protein [Haloarchaeobius amylolyticus]
MSQYATSAPRGATHTEQSQAADDRAADEPDADALRERIDELERELSARETQVQALRQRYETVLDERQQDRSSSPQSTRPGLVQTLLTRLQALLS